MLPRMSLFPDRRKELDPVVVGSFFPSSSATEYHSSGIRASQDDEALGAVDSEVL